MKSGGYNVTTMGDVVPMIPGTSTAAMVEACRPFCPPPERDASTIAVVALGSAAVTGILVWALMRR